MERAKFVPERLTFGSGKLQVAKPTEAAKPQIFWQQVLIVVFLAAPDF
jgi:hypothetical protein